jgi:hypothetical protein
MECPLYYQDADYAREKFFGKSIEEVLPYFFDSVLGAGEDISYMPPIPFRYYIFAFTQFLMSEDTLNCDHPRHAEASDGASSFLGLVRQHLRDYPEFILPVMEEIMPVVEFVGTHQALYEAAEDIYGSFPDLVKEIKTLYAAF